MSTDFIYDKGGGMQGIGSCIGRVEGLNYLAGEAALLLLLSRGK